MKHFILPALALLAALTSCMKKSPEKIYDEVATGIVLVMNEEYYAFELDDSTSLYFSGLEQGKLANATFSLEEIAANTQRRYAVGCYVDSEGEVLTTDSVVVQTVDRETAIAALRTTAKKLIIELENEANAATDSYADLQIKLVDAQSALGVGSYFGTLGEEETAALENRIADIEDSLSALLKVNLHCNINSVLLRKLDYAEVDFRSFSALGIAHNNSFISSTSDFMPCNVREIQGKYALLHLENRETPSAAYIFSIADEDAMAQAADYAIGFLRGMQPIGSSSGITAQIVLAAEADTLSSSFLLNERSEIFAKMKMPDEEEKKR